MENPLSEILEGSSPRQWRHVPGAANPADDASRGFHPAELFSDHRWLDGPNFLLLSEEH